MMKTRDHVFERNGLIFIHEMTLCMHHEMLSGMAVAERYQL